MISAQAIPDLSSCNGQTACSVSSLLNVSNPFVLAWAQNYFSNPVHVTVFLGIYTTDLQKICRTIPDKPLQDWTITADKTLSGSGLGYMFFTANQPPLPTQDVFLRFSSDSTTPLGNCIIVTKPLTLVQSAAELFTPVPSAPNQITPQQPNSPNNPNTPQQTSNITTSSPDILKNFIIIIACSIAAAIFVLLILIFTILFLRKRRSKHNYLNESLVAKNGTTQSIASQSNTPTIHQIPIPTPLLVDPFLDPTDPSEIKRAETKLHIVDAHLIAETFRKELSDPLASNGWDASSAGSGGNDRNIARGNSKTSHTSSNISPISHFGLDRIV